MFVATCWHQQLVLGLLFGQAPLHHVAEVQAEYIDCVGSMLLTEVWLQYFGSIAMQQGTTW